MREVLYLIFLPFVASRLYTVGQMASPPGTTGGLGHQVTTVTPLSSTLASAAMLINSAMDQVLAMPTSLETMLPDLAINIRLPKWVSALSLIT